MIIVGKGQLAKSFLKIVFLINTIIFASGVSNSNTTDIKTILKGKKDLLLDTLQKKIEIKNLSILVVCALSASEYPKNGLL